MQFSFKLKRRSGRKYSKQLALEKKNKLNTWLYGEGLSEPLIAEWVAPQAGDAGSKHVASLVYLVLHGAFCVSSREARAVVWTPPPSSHRACRPSLRCIRMRSHRSFLVCRRFYGRFEESLQNLRRNSIFICWDHAEDSTAESETYEITHGEFKLECESSSNVNTKGSGFFFSHFINYYKFEIKLIFISIKQTFFQARTFLCHILSLTLQKLVKRRRKNVRTSLLSRLLGKIVTYPQTVLFARIALQNVLSKQLQQRAEDVRESDAQASAWKFGEASRALYCILEIGSCQVINVRVGLTNFLCRIGTGGLVIIAQESFEQNHTSKANTRWQYCS